VRQRSFVIVAAFLAVLVVAAGGAYLYDHGRRDLIAQGIRVDNVDLGGLRADQARVRLQRELLAPLNRGIVVRAAGKPFHLTAREARISANIGGMVDAAVARSREGSIVTRVARGLTGGHVNAVLPAQVAYSHPAVGRLVSRVKQALTIPVRDADVSFSASGPKVVRARTGRALDKDALRTQVERDLVRPGQQAIVATTHIIKPKVTSNQLAKRYPAIIVINRAAFQLRFYHDLKLEKTYKIAVGRQGLETPAGLYHIQDKQVNPSWHVPNSAWAGKLAGRVIPPGPDDPIKARWMGVDGGAGIHGTEELASLGTAASHGCIRMAIPDVIQLYSRVPTGAPVYIA
jgi:lipoprotein-anchoring transpeptidase ErfK/SrfK